MSRVFVLGCPRSGTSMLTGLFAKADFFVGKTLLKPTVSNPAGYFETKEVNDINNKLIQEIVNWPAFNRLLRRRIDLCTNVDPRAYPFASPAFLRKVSIDNATVSAIEEHVSRNQFCYKDPRFCVTLPTWLNYIDKSECKFLVVFREPARTFESYVKNGNEVYSPPILLRVADLETAYARNYSRLLRWSKKNWLFVHYDQLLNATVQSRLEEFVGVSLAWSHVDVGLQRSRGNVVLRTDSRALEVYKKLCMAANHV